MKKPALVLFVLFLPSIPFALASHWSHQRTYSIGSLQIGGLAIQLLGFVTVWLQIRGALREHRRPGWLQRILAWWKARPGQKHIVASMASALGNATVSGAGRATTNSDGSVGGRLNALEQNLGHLQDEIDGMRTEQRKSAAALKAQLEAESRVRASATDELRKRMEDQAVGSADLQLVGLYWFVVGSVLSTVPQLLLSVLGRL